MATKSNLIPVKKGEVRNPKGRPVGTKNKKTLLRMIVEGNPKLKEHMKEVEKYGMDKPEFAILAEFANILSNEEAKDSDRLNAGNSILDRELGKSVQRVEQKNEDITPSKIELVAPDLDESTSKTTT